MSIRIENDQATPIPSELTNRTLNKRIAGTGAPGEVLRREPDTGGWNYHTAQISQCVFDPGCLVFMRPQDARLFRNGALIPYREEVEQRIRAKDENPRLIEVTNDVFLEPNLRSLGHGISLKDWYGTLPPGSYRLTNRRRFEIDGPWTAESAPLLFEVIPPKKN